MKDRDKAENKIEKVEKTEIATFAAGCFWHVEDAFMKLPGVSKTEVGYTGGDMENPSYKDVCSDETRHAEVVRVEFDPEKISYEELLGVFWSIHNPTQLNRQGVDFGTQYRSAIFYHTLEQKKKAAASMKEEQKKYDKEGKKIVTQIVKAPKFFKAEEYHQHYLEKNGLPSCRI